jgi:hypothetical protein
VVASCHNARSSLDALTFLTTKAAAPTSPATIRSFFSMPNTPNGTTASKPNREQSVATASEAKRYHPTAGNEIRSATATRAKRSATPTASDAIRSATATRGVRGLGPRR